MNKGDLVARIAKDACITKGQAEAALNSFAGAITSALKKGEKVTLVGFLSFSVAQRKARIGRNPQTGATIKIAARKVPKIVAGSELKKALKKAPK